MEQNKRLYLAFAIIVIFLIWCFHKTKTTVESFDTFKSISAEYYLPNSNAFGNYYRNSFRLSKQLGWKPTETWDHLRPEFNENPSCYHVDKIYD